MCVSDLCVLKQIRALYNYTYIFIYAYIYVIDVIYLCYYFTVIVYVLFGYS